MPENKHSIEVVREWIAKAENDLKTATHTLKLGARCPTDTVCFHAQQCIEKYLKALLVFKKIDFPKTHDLSELIVLLPSGIDTGLTLLEQRELSGYATAARYPGDYEPISLSEARKAVNMARKVRKEIRKYLRAALSQRKNHLFS